jgi:hypothetical protein
LTYLWIVPARVGGTWNFRADGDQPFTVRFDQTFQKINGEATIGGAKQALKNATLAGDQIRFAFADEKGATRTVTGHGPQRAKSPARPALRAAATCA